MNTPYVNVNAPLAMSYVPWQTWGSLYNETLALERGTVFPALDLPFLSREEAK